MSVEAKLPYIRIEPSPGRLQVRWNGHIVAETVRALKLTEGRHAGVYYVPRSDVAMDLLTRTEHLSHCPHKGQASYYAITAGGRTVQNAAWSYETPIPDVAAIAGHLAFYPDRVDSIEQTAA
jgi:uncharacterized protein (DUF427 family)